MNLTRILALALRSILFLVLVVSTSRLFAQLNVNENANNATMSNLIQGSGVIISNFTVISGTDQQVSSFTNTNAVGNPLNIPNGLLLSTGRGTQAVGPNNNAGSSVGNGINYVDPDITAIQGNATNDVVVVEFDVIPLCDTMQLTFVFGSEEYAE
ncbi:MAG: choice-of-anchor L domain-containing protein, partial [Flavobacteriales bacterium]